MSFCIITVSVRIFGSLAVSYTGLLLFDGSVSCVRASDAGGADGVMRLWRYPSFEKIREVKASDGLELKYGDYGAIAVGS
jgi:hypothetical protein